MSLIRKVHRLLVEESRELSPAQLAQYTGAAKSTVRARVSELRAEGYAIYLNRKVDSQGRVRNVYRVGVPSRAVVSMGNLVLREMKAGRHVLVV